MGAALRAIVAVSGLAAPLVDQALGNRLGVFFAKETSQIVKGDRGRMREEDNSGSWRARFSIQAAIQTVGTSPFAAC